MAPRRGRGPAYGVAEIRGEPAEAVPGDQPGQGGQRAAGSRRDRRLFSFARLRLPGQRPPAVQVQGSVRQNRIPSRRVGDDEHARQRKPLAPGAQGLRVARFPGQQENERGARAVFAQPREAAGDLPRCGCIGFLAQLRRDQRLVSADPQRPQVAQPGGSAGVPPEEQASRRAAGEREQPGVDARHLTVHPAAGGGQRFGVQRAGLVGDPLADGEAHRPFAAGRQRDGHPQRRAGLAAAGQTPGPGQPARGFHTAVPSDEQRAVVQQIAFFAVSLHAH